MNQYEVGAPLWVYDEQWGERVAFTIAEVDELDEYTTNLKLYEVDGDRSLETTAADLAKLVRSGAAGEPGKRSR